MKILKLLILFGFFLHYYVVLAFTTLVNLVKYCWRAITQKSTEKNHISPFQATHAHVFVPLHEVISHDGFLIDNHEFATQDNASVCLWRIRLANSTLSKPYPVLMMHGLLDCSASWFMHVDKSKTLPYMLASSGYDVWIGNNRGNRISHDDKEQHPDYWEYNFDHLIEHDQPTIIEGVLAETGKEKIIYLGHSQGSAQFVLGMGVNTHLQNKIAGFIGLGTVVSFQNVKSHLVLQVMSNCYLLEICNWLGFKQILVLPKVLSRAVGVLIYNSRFHYEIIMRFIRLLCGHSEKNRISSDLFGVMITHEPGGSSANNALHWIQCYRNGEMRKFDYGASQNKKIYGTSTPPAYTLTHLSSLPFETYLFRGMKDAVMSGIDFQELVSKFSEDKIFTYELPDYHHLDYVWSETAHADLYGHVIDIIEAKSK